MLLSIDLTFAFPLAFAMEALSSQCETQTRQPPAVSLPNGLRLDMKAQGSPEIWNANGETLYWGKRTANMLRNESLSLLTTQERKLAFFYNFPKDRLDHCGRPVATCWTRLCFTVKGGCVSSGFLVVKQLLV